MNNSNNFFAWVVLLILALGGSLVRARAQSLAVTNLDGGSVFIDAGLGVKFHEGSSLRRTWIVINDTNCPIQLLPSVAVNRELEGKHYVEIDGDLIAQQPSRAYSVGYIMYDYFNDAIETSAQTFASDWNSQTNYPLSLSINENYFTGLLTGVVFVSRVRESDGSVWKSDEAALGAELIKLKLSANAPSILSGKK